MYRRPDGSPGFRTGRACRSHALFAGNMEGNTTASALAAAVPADAIWLSVAAVRGPLEVFGYQSLAFSPGVSVLGLGKQVRASHCSPQCDYLLTSCPCRCCLTTTRVSSAHKGNFFLTHVDARAPADCRREEGGKSVQALRSIDLQTRSTDLDVFV